MPYNASKYDIAGSFGRGQEVTRRYRQGRQLERAVDYELAREEENLQGRRAVHNLVSEEAGLDPYDFGELQTNQDPLLFRLINGWFNKKSNAVKPSRSLPGEDEQAKTTEKEMARVYAAPSAEPLSMGQPYREEFANGGRAIPSTSPGVNGYADGGIAARNSGPIAVHAPRQRGAYGSAGIVPQRYADGGSVEEELAQRNARNRAAYERRAAERGLSPRQLAERNPKPRAAALRNIATAPEGAGIARRMVNSKVGGALVGTAGIASAIDSATTPTDQYRERFGFGPSKREGIPQAIEDVGVRALGAASDLGNALTGGIAGGFYRDQQEQDPAQALVEETLPNEPPPSTPDEAVAQAAIVEGTAMAEEAAEAARPPGEVDFSKVDFTADEIPNMPVKDWVNYRGRMVQALTAQGMSAADAHSQVTREQQQGFVDYMRQAQMHLMAGDPSSAASAAKMAYQYFPNGSDVKFGVYTDPQTGNPMLMGSGFDEETGEPKGNPMLLDPEKMNVMMENFSNPNAFTAWTKDWRDEAFKEREYEEVTKPAAESTARYQDRLGRAATTRAQADLAGAARAGASGGRKQSDLDRANAAFMDTVEMLGFEDQGQADEMMSVMSQIYTRSDWQYPQVIEFVRRATDEGRLEDVKSQLALQ